MGTIRMVCVVSAFSPITSRASALRPFCGAPNPFHFVDGHRIQVQVVDQRALRPRAAGR